MATISPSDRAPDETVHYSFAGVEFDLGGSAKKSFDSDDRAVIANAQTHPWLKVEFPAVEVIGGQILDNQVKPEDDPLSGLNSVAFDPDEIKKVEDAKAAVVASPVVIDANLTQTEPVESNTGSVAFTLAADETHEAAKSAKPFKENDPTATAPADPAASVAPPADPAAAPDTSTQAGS
jgi:hypothetical protein